MKIKTFKNANDFTSAATDFIVAFCQTNSPPLKIALSGGSTPKPIYQALAKRPDLDFNKLEFFQVDERYVPKNHPESNYHLIYESLFNNVDPNKSTDDIGNRLPCIQGGKGGVYGLAQNLQNTFYHFDTSLPIKKSLSTYQKILTRKVPHGFDLTLLGLGPDGHTASLFPHSSAIHETSQLVAHAQTNHFAIKDRLTLTFSFILKSQTILLLLKGHDKKPILDELLHSQKSIDELPAKALLSHKNLQIFYGDY